MAVAEALPILAKIHSTGYWRINIRPTAFEEYRIPDLSTCLDIMESVQVSLRGWNYPHIGRDILNSSDWIESQTEFRGHVDFWRFYQSGQFIHHRAVKEDYAFRDQKVLSVISALYTVTEIFEFAGRLAEKNILHPAGEISIHLRGMNGRALMDEYNVASDDHVARIESIASEAVYEQGQLIGQRAEYALEATIGVLEKFNWATPSRSLLAEEQHKFLERRI